ncbi:hypothetical protein [Sanguibacter sp. 25GB23B1]|uniref:hypothetical protein n=1 Tax=unclassified Sanguibacter TaxID=2645534 RepID=UPI0032AFF15D
MTGPTPQPARSASPNPTLLLVVSVVAAVATNIAVDALTDLPMLARWGIAAAAAVAAVMLVTWLTGLAGRTSRDGSSGR